MKKKIMMILLVLAIALLPAAAGSWVQLGVSGTMDLPLAEGSEISAASFHYGPEARINLLFLTAGDTLNMQYADGQFTMMNTVFAELYFKFLFMKASVGMGMDTPVFAGEDFVKFPEAMDYVTASSVNYRAGLGFSAGSVCDINVQAIVPGGAVTPDDMSFFTPNWEATKVSVGVLFNLF